MSEELIEEIPAEESVEEIAGEYPEITYCRIAESRPSIPS